MFFYLTGLKFTVKKKTDIFSEILNGNENMFYYDAHCHLQIKTRLEKAKEAGVKYFIVNSTHPDNWERVCQLAKERNDVLPCLGVHPWFVQNLPICWMSILGKILHENPQIMIGEIGLDATYPDLPYQADIFEKCLKLAQIYKRPVHIHGHKAWAHVINILKCFPGTVCLIHRFSGPEIHAQRLLEFKNVYFSLMNPRAASFIPVDRILVESDSPGGTKYIENVIETGNRCGCGWEQLDHNFLNFLNHLPAARAQISEEPFV